MSSKYPGVYGDDRGGWYFKATLGRDPLTGKRDQVTRRGYTRAKEASDARAELLGKVARRELRPGASTLTVDQLLDRYFDGLDADNRLTAKTLFDYRHNADDYVRPHLGPIKVRDVTPEVVEAWQRLLGQQGGTKLQRGDDGKPQPGKGLSPNTVRLARAPLAGAFKLAMKIGLISVNPVAQVSRPKPMRSIPHHWSPEEARTFLMLMHGDRTWPIWAFLLGSGVRIGELVWLRWANVDLERRLVRIKVFASTMGYDLVPSPGKSRDAVRTIDLDDGVVRALRLQRRIQAEERLAATDYTGTDYVFTKISGGHYHPQWLSQRLGVFSRELDLPRITAHGLRHTSATLMLSEGVPPKVAAERLGHSDPSLFMKLYSHVTPTMQRDAADRLGAALFGPDGITNDL